MYNSSMMIQYYFTSFRVKSIICDPKWYMVILNVGVISTNFVSLYSDLLNIYKAYMMFQTSFGMKSRLMTQNSM